MSKILGDTPQKRAEKENKKKAAEGKRTRGQQTLTGGASSSHRLTDFFTEFEECISKW